MIRSDAITLPTEFQVSLYENLIDQLQKKAVTKRVYRDGDRSANNADDLITLQCSVVKFKKGNETLREVTTVAGGTSMTPAVPVHGQGWNTVWVRDITGKVRFLAVILRQLTISPRRRPRSRMKIFFRCRPFLNKEAEKNRNDSTYHLSVKTRRLPGAFPLKFVVTQG